MSEKELDMERIHAMFEEMRKEKEERLKMDYAEYVEKQGRGNCVEELMAIRKNVNPLNFVACNDDEIPVGASKSGGLSRSSANDTNSYIVWVYGDLE